MTSIQKIANKIIEILKIYKVYFDCLVIYSSHILVLTLFTKILYIYIIVS
jgi:hypothetical protein